MFQYPSLTLDLWRRGGKQAESTEIATDIPWITPTYPPPTWSVPTNPWEGLPKTLPPLDAPFGEPEPTDRSRSMDYHYSVPGFGQADLLVWIPCGPPPFPLDWVFADIALIQMDLASSGLEISDPETYNKSAAVTPVPRSAENPLGLPSMSFVETVLGPYLDNQPVPITSSATIRMPCGPKPFPYYCDGVRSGFDYVDTLMKTMFREDLWTSDARAFANLKYPQTWPEDRISPYTYSTEMSQCYPNYFTCSTRIPYYAVSRLRVKDPRMSAITVGTTTQCKVSTDCTTEPVVNWVTLSTPIASLLMLASGPDIEPEPPRTETPDIMVLDENLTAVLRLYKPTKAPVQAREAFMDATRDQKFPAESLDDFIQWAAEKPKTTKASEGCSGEKVCSCKSSGATSSSVTLGPILKELSGPLLVPVPEPSYPPYKEGESKTVGVEKRKRFLPKAASFFSSYLARQIRQNDAGSSSIEPEKYSSPLTIRNAGGQWYLPRPTPNVVPAYHATVIDASAGAKANEPWVSPTSTSTLPKPTRVSTTLLTLQHHRPNPVADAAANNPHTPHIHLFPGRPTLQKIRPHHSFQLDSSWPTSYPTQLLEAASHHVHAIRASLLFKRGRIDNTRPDARADYSGPHMYTPTPLPTIPGQVVKLEYLDDWYVDPYDPEKQPYLREEWYTVPYPPVVTSSVSSSVSPSVSVVSSSVVAGTPVGRGIEDVREVVHGVVGGGSRTGALLLIAGFVMAMLGVLWCLRGTPDNRWVKKRAEWEV